MYPIRLTYNFARQMALLIWEIWPVFFFVRKMTAGALPDDHPWVTGETEDGQPIWPQNIIYRSPTTMNVDDAVIATKVGLFLRSMVKRSVPSDPEIPVGSKRRMPHAVNYIHGSVHHNGVFMIFDDEKDLRKHLANRAFRKDVRAFVRKEKREVTIILRDRTIDPTEYAFCVAATRAYLPYFTNGNAPTERAVLWGNKSPYFALNPINGSWIRDTWDLYRGRLTAIVRKPVGPETYFRASYDGDVRDFTWLERLGAWLMFLDVRARGFRGNIFFSERKDFEPKSVESFREKGYWRWYNINRVPHPFRPRPSKEIDLSIVIPTLNEAEEIGMTIAATQRAMPGAEIIVVDGGSTDETREIAWQMGARVAYSPAGRGRQLNFGAQLASGDVLCFLHADARPDEGAGDVLARHFTNPRNQICTMRLRFRRRNPVYKPLGWVTRLDGFIFSYGDQGICVRRSFYDDLGGFSTLKNFEDVEFLKRARRSARIRSARTKVRVSSRRFEKNGLFRELFLNSKLMTQYAMGRDPSELQRRYQERTSKR